MVNIQFGCICECCIIVRADPISRLGRTSAVDYDTRTITLQHIFAIIRRQFGFQCVKYFFHVNIDLPSVTGARDGDPMGKQSAVVIAARPLDGDYEAAEGSSGAII